MLNLVSPRGQKQNVREWVANMPPNDRLELHKELLKYVGTVPVEKAVPENPGSTTVVSLEKLQSEFGKLSKKDKLTHIRNIQEGVSVAEAAVEAAKPENQAWQQAVVDARRRRLAAGLGEANHGRR